MYTQYKKFKQQRKINIPSAKKNISEAFFKTKITKNKKKNNNKNKNQQKLQNKSISLIASYTTV